MVHVLFKYIDWYRHKRKAYTYLPHHSWCCTHGLSWKSVGTERVEIILLTFMCLCTEMRGVIHTIRLKKKILLLFVQKLQTNINRYIMAYSLHLRLLIHQKTHILEISFVSSAIRILLHKKHTSCIQLLR